MATRAANLVDLQEDGRRSTVVEQVKRLRPRCEGDESPLCLGLNLNGERCNRPRREPFCDRHLYQWEALTDETRTAISALAELPENAFNHALWDSEHLKLRTFLRDVYTRLQAEAVGDSARAWDALHEQAQEEAKGALLAVQDTLRGECAPALIPCQGLSSQLLVAQRYRTRAASARRRWRVCATCSLGQLLCKFHLLPLCLELAPAVGPRLVKTAGLPVLPALPRMWSLCVLKSQHSEKLSSP